MEDAELYQKSNSLQRRDAIQCLDTYARKIKFRKFDRVIDIGCGDGGVTNILKTYMPANCKILGCDISEKMIRFANENHGNKRTEFIVLDIEGNLPHALRESFEHAFSFYTLHWIKNQETAFRNIYKLLTENGDCLLMFLGHMPIFDVYRRLARNNKWCAWLGDVDRYVSPYHDSQNPEKQITKLLDNIGFSNIDIKCKQLEYKYDNVDMLKKAVAAINPFNIPKNLFEDFLEDYIKVTTDLNMMDPINNNIGEDLKIRVSYTLITIKSEASLRSVSKSEMKIQSDVNLSPSDKLSVKIQSLRLMDEDPKRFTIKVTFLDQLILTGAIKAIGAKSLVRDRTLVRGTMLYDPSDYERMCLFADCPLTVSIQPMKSVESNLSAQTFSPQTSLSHKSSSKSESIVTSVDDIYCCNVDILPLFIDKHKMSVEKRMEPLVKPSTLHRKSWDNLPVLSMELAVSRNKFYEHHHKVLNRANYMKVTLVASYNMLIPYDEEYVYTAASKIPLQNETNTSLVTYNQGYRILKRFNGMSFFPKWESLRVGEDVFTKGDEKFQCRWQDLQNGENIDLEHYLTKEPSYHSVVWASFHRTLMLENSDRWLWKHLRQYHWPFELHIYGEKGGYSFMAFLDLFRLLYPGEDTIRIAVPLQWINAETMMDKCGCELLLTPNEKAPSTSATTQKPSKATTESAPTSVSTDTGFFRPTGADDNCAFIIVEVKLARPLKKIVIPPYISSKEIKEMHKELERSGPAKRECSGRGQLDRDWQSTVRIAVNSLRKVPYYGMTEFCIFNRQLSETRTRVELTTSFWQDAAVYVNNNFVVQDFLHSDETFEEMVMMAHACLTRTACETLVGVNNRQLMDPTLQAARHARQMQDIPHATELYLQLVVQKPRDGSSWRELGVCLLDVDRDWANVCINKSVVLDPRHPLSLLTKGAMVFEENPARAEPFFVALLALFPFWTTAWVATSAYYIERELFHVADQIIKFVKQTHAEGLHEDIGPRAWDRELGDWWDNTPVLPGMNRYYDAADLLLRLRALTLAEACVSRALLEEGESAAYFHLVALCCRLRGNIEEALCHIKTGIEKYGEISYLRSLEAECYHMQKNIAAATISFEKAGSCIGAYSILLSTPIREPQHARTILVDLVRRQPSAYTWMALADDWMTRAATGEGGDAGATDEQVAAKTCAIACAVQALKWDRRAGKAWALLSKLVKPSARRLHCETMASACGYIFMTNERMEYSSESKQSLCHHLGTSLRECRCKLCENIKF